MGFLSADQCGNDGVLQLTVAGLHGAGGRCDLAGSVGAKHGQRWEAFAQ